MNPIKLLLYGDAGSGKSALGVSAFWDFKAGKKLREGRWLLIGQEDNDALGVPEEYIRRFISPKDDLLKFAKDFTLYLEASVATANKKGAPEAFIIDSLSEWNHLFLYEHAKKLGGDKWDKYQEAKDRFIGAVQMLNPRVLNAHVIATARVDQKKNGVKSRSTGETAGADPEYWSDFKYVPAMEGWPRKNLSHYFDIVSYVEADVADVRTLSGALRRGSVHRYYMVPSGDFLVKNRWEHQWLRADKPDCLTNPLFDDMMRELDDAIKQNNERLTA